MVLTGEMATVVSLQELGCLVKSFKVLIVSFFLFAHDFLQLLSSALFFDSFGPLLTDLGKLLLVVIEVSLLVVALPIFLSHVLIVRLQRLSVLLVRTIV